MIYMMLGLLIPIGLTSCYVYFFIKRFLTEFMHVEFSKRRKIILHGVTLVLSLPAVNVFGIYAIVYLHLLVISMVLELINLVLRRYKWFRFGFGTGIFSLVIMLMIFGYGYYNINKVNETEYTLTSSKVDGLKILQITDLHMSNAIDQQELKEYCNEMSKLEPDIVVLTGDIVDERTPLEDMKAACEMLSKISNKKGIYYVFGNHDPASYSTHSQFNAADVEKEFVSHGVTVLKDQAVTVDDVTIVGRMDASVDRSRMSSEELLKGIDKDKYVILLDHQPLDIDKNASLGVDLQLSGHTHGGQLFPLREVQTLFTNTLVYGKRTINDFTAITSSGISAWGYPLRTEGKSEYVLITVE
ncbi:MAG: metallophosphoesterase [bacterium]|nr:metallophosphoesterase [bacterium]